MSVYSAATGKILAGNVVSYDEDAGLGVIAAGDGCTYPFHATAIADGSRSITSGSEVHFLVVFAPRGRLEAAQVSVR
jgi:cold shock CspA family protein